MTRYCVENCIWPCPSEQGLTFFFLKAGAPAASLPAFLLVESVISSVLPYLVSLQYL